MSVRTLRWWIREGGEVCVFCVQAYEHGTQVWCAACDRAICACCVRFSPAPERKPLCPECEAGKDDGE